MSGALRLDLLRRAALNELARHESELLLAALGPEPDVAVSEVRMHAYGKLEREVRAYVPVGARLWLHRRFRDDSDAWQWRSAVVMFGDPLPRRGVVVLTKHGARPSPMRSYTVRQPVMRFVRDVVNGIYE